MAAQPSANLQRLCQLLVQDTPEITEALPEDLIKLAQDTRVLHVLASRPGLKQAMGQKAHRIVLAQAAVGAILLEEFRRISSALNDRNIPIAPLKGMAYALMFESGGPLRPMDDIDLLVQKDHFAPALQVMNDLGYKDMHPHGIEHSDQYHERGLRNGRFFVEIHRAFAPEGRFGVDFPALWSRTIPINVEDVTCHRLCPVDTLLYHCVHMGLHHFSFSGLGALWDLRRLLLENPCDLSRASRRAREWGTLRMTWCCLRLMDICFPGSILREEMDCFAPGLFWRILLDRLVVSPSVGLLEGRKEIPRPARLLKKALLMEKIQNMPSYAWWYVKQRLRSRSKSGPNLPV